MTDLVLEGALSLWPALLGGALLGAAFYGSLWWTVREGLVSSRPTRWFVCSMVLRMGGALVAIYLIGNGRWERLVICLLGFVMARTLVVRLTPRIVVPLEGQRS